MNIATAQADFGRAYAGGAAGVLVSGLVWLIAGLVWQTAGLERAFVVLFIGGMAIHPLATLLTRFGLRCPPVNPTNPLTRLALESTIALFVGIAIAFVLLMREPALAIPAFAGIVGARYFVFRTLFGTALFWVLGGAMAWVGVAALFGWVVPLGNMALHIGVIEVLFAAVLFARRRQSLV